MLTGVVEFHQGPTSKVVEFSQSNIKKSCWVSPESQHKNCWLGRFSKIVELLTCPLLSCWVWRCGVQAPPRHLARMTGSTFASETGVRPQPIWRSAKLCKSCWDDRIQSCWVSCVLPVQSCWVTQKGFWKSCWVQCFLSERKLLSSLVLLQGKVVECQKKVVDSSSKRVVDCGHRSCWVSAAAQTWWCARKLLSSKIWCWVDSCTGVEFWCWVLNSWCWVRLFSGPILNLSDFCKGYIGPCHN